MKSKGGFILSLAILIFLLILAYQSLGYRPKARLVPLIVGVPTIVAAFLQVFKEGQSLRQRPGNNESGSKDETGKAGSVVAGNNNIFYWAFLFLALLFAAGFQVGLPVFTFLYLKILGRRSTGLAASISLGLLAVIYVAFGVGLRIHFYQGLIWEQILQL